MNHQAEGRLKSWVVRFSALLLSLPLFACSDPGPANASGPDAAKADSGLDSGVEDAHFTDAADAADAADAVDASLIEALDPARCPAFQAQDFHGFEPSYTRVSSGSALVDKLFYSFAAIDSDAGAASAIDGDAALVSLAAARSQAFVTGLAACDRDAACLRPSFTWTGDEIAQVSARLQALVASSPALAAVVSGHLRKSGVGVRHAAGTDAQLLVAVWEDTARISNKAWDDYAGAAPAAALELLLTGISNDATGKRFYEPTLALVGELLRAVDRPEATRYEPLEAGENRAAVQHIPSIDFSGFPYSVIVVPGKGPSNLDQPLDPNGQVRADQAAQRFRAGLAPLIALSGGHVHPDRTPYAEALEMKKYLMTALQIPEEVIVVDPHARHTTTNLRNVARLLYRYGVPFDRPSLITSDFLQVAYMAASDTQSIYGKRNLDELGYLPYQGLTQLGLLDDCWLPSVSSMYIDGNDLLDP